MENSFYIVDNHLRIKSDIGAKRTFANPQYKENTIHLIEDFFHFTPKDIHFIQPYHPEIMLAESGNIASETEVDILVDVDDGKQISIEIQLRSHPYFMERILHYEASRYTDNYGDNQHQYKGFAKYYSSLIPVYTLCLVDFIAFQADDSYFHKFELYDRKNDIFYLGEKNEQLLQISILELAKVGKTSDNIVRNWASLFRFNQVDETAPDYLKKIVTETEVLSLKKEEIALISEKERNKLHSQLYLEESYLEGERQGKAEGLEQGVTNVARNLFLQGFDLALVQSVTGLGEILLQKIQESAEKENK